MIFYKLLWVFFLGYNVDDDDDDDGLTTTAVIIQSMTIRILPLSLFIILIREEEMSRFMYVCCQADTGKWIKNQNRFAFGVSRKNLK